MKLTKDSDLSRETELEQMLVSLSVCFSDHIKYANSGNPDVKDARKMISDSFKLGMQTHIAPRTWEEIMGDLVGFISATIDQGLYDNEDDLKALLAEAKDKMKGDAE